MAIRTTSSLAESQYQSFLMEDDLILAREAAAGNIKLIDGLLLEDPGNKELTLLASKALFSYTFGYVESENTKRASKLYLRALSDGAIPLGGDKLFLESSRDSFLAQMQKDFPKLKEHYFWSVINFASWVNLNKSDLLALNNREKIALTGMKMIDVDPEYYYGGPHLLMGMYHAGQPAMLGGKPELAKYHFETCMQINERKFLPALYFYATQYAVATQNRALFETLMQDILAFDVDTFPEQRLSNRLIQEKSKVWMSKIDDLFL